MLTRIKCDRIILCDRIFDGYVYFDGNKITDVTTDTRPADVCYDYTGRYLSPGFIESHTHGCGGEGYLCGDKAQIARITDCHLAHGATTVYPTLVACTYEEMLTTLQAISDAISEGLCLANVPGAHIEGPYLALSQCGGQPPKNITPPIEKEYKEIVHRFGNIVKRWTYAPERDEGGEFCRYISSKGILPSIGHTDAIYPEVCQAIDNGARLVTHLYSCMSTVTRDHGFRRLGVIESTFLRDELTAELICDGKHLPPELIKMIVKAKGFDGIIATTDSIDVAATSLKTGYYSDTHYIIEDGVAKLYDRTAFAGSIATCDVLIKTLVKECGFGIPESVRTLTKNVAKLFGLSKGEIRAGLDADLIVFDEDFNVSDVFVLGNKVK